MGKYIVEIGRLERLYKASVNGNGKPNMTWLSPEVDLTPYTEPDLEQVRKEAYQKGYETGYEDGYSEPGKNQQEAYQRGLADAWDAARKIASDDAGQNHVIFGQHFANVIFNTFTASEAIEKISQYEQEKLFCVGDEFENESGKRFVIIKMDGTEIDRYMDGEGKTYCMIVKYQVIRKTGRHFPEIATVLEKMRGEQDG